MTCFPHHFWLDCFMIVSTALLLLPSALWNIHLHMRKIGPKTVAKWWGIWRKGNLLSGLPELKHSTTCTKHHRSKARPNRSITPLPSICHLLVDAKETYTGWCFSDRNHFVFGCLVGATPFGDSRKRQRLKLLDGLRRRGKISSFFVVGSGLRLTWQQTLRLLFSGSNCFLPHFLCNFVRDDRLSARASFDHVPRMCSRRRHWWCNRRLLL